MINSNPDYYGMLLYGIEDPKSVGNPELFSELALKLQRVFEQHSINVRCRGFVSGHLGRNEAPRAGAFNQRMLTVWKMSLEQIEHRTFRRFELFGPVWKDHQSPLLYAAIDKLDVMLPLPNASDEERRAGAGNCITLAVHKRILNMTLAELETLARECTLGIAGFYGYVNTSDAWDYAYFKPGGMRCYLMDIRFRDVIAKNYRCGKYQMTGWVPDLYRGNILSNGHFADGAPQSLAQMEGCQIEAWSDAVTYVRFRNDPQADSQFRESMTKYFKIVPRPLDDE